MFANIAVVLSTLVFFVVAAPGGPTGVSQCNTGSLQCCDQVSAPESEEAQHRADGLGIDITNVIGNIGFQCNPISLVNVLGGANCGQAPVCCQGNQFNGLINVGCVGAAV